MNKDLEIEAIKTVAKALLSVDAKARARILTWATDWVYGLERKEMHEVAEKESA